MYTDNDTQWSIDHIQELGDAMSVVNKEGLEGISYDLTQIWESGNRIAFTQKICTLQHMVESVAGKMRNLSQSVQTDVSEYNRKATEEELAKEKTQKAT